MRMWGKTDYLVNNVLFSQVSDDIAGVVMTKLWPCLKNAACDLPGAFLKMWRFAKMYLLYYCDSSLKSFYRFVTGCLKEMFNV